jgi:trehalose 6-phosphate synthase
VSTTGRRVVIVANRLPLQWDEAKQDWSTSPGGLVSALTPIVRRTQGTWVGWTGVPTLAPAPFEHDGIRQRPVRLSAAEYRDFYVGFCNGTLWPLYHDAIRAPEFHRHWWGPYVKVNRRFAAAAAQTVGTDDVVWVQDYQLQLVPGMLRKARPVHRIGFYLHIPFPPLELFGRLPWRRQVLEGLLGADVLGFQSQGSQANFARAARHYAGVDGTSDQVTWNDREIRLQCAPIAIDAELVGRSAASEETRVRSDQIRSDLGKPDIVILGVDRLDYTKGIDRRIRAIETLFDRSPRLAERVVFVQVAVPSREDVAAYRLIRNDIEALVGRVNGKYGALGRAPIQYQYRTLPFDELVAYYRAADIMLVTPLRDGMNLVAKEYVATRFDNSGVLVLSEFAGAAEQMTRALIVNPYDLDGLADTLLRAIEMSSEEKAGRMQSLRRLVTQNDVYAWAASCLEALDA